MVSQFSKGRLPVRLTQRTVAALTLPPGKADAIYFDDDLPSFGLRIREGGSRMFVVCYKIGAKQRRVTLGSTAILKVEAAREKARDLLATVRLGGDPAGAKAEARARAGDTCEAAIRRYLIHQKARLRPRSYIASEHYLLTKFEPLHPLPLAAISRRMVAERISQIATDSGPSAADRARVALSSLFAWAMREGLVEANPVIATNKHSSGKGRERVLSEAELVEVWRAAGNDAYSTILKLLILTGQRREEIGALRWSEIDFAAQMIRLPAERVKNGRAHDVPLADPAMRLLQAVPRRIGPRDFVFGAATGFCNYTVPKRALDQRIAAVRQAAGIAPMAPWVLHDLRRSLATGLGERLGVAPHVVEAILNHIDGHKRGVAGVYNRAVYEKEKRAALCAWADHVLAAVEDRTDKVVPLRA
jgi:integrase